MMKDDWIPNSGWGQRGTWDAGFGGGHSLNEEPGSAVEPVAGTAFSGVAAVKPLSEMRRGRCRYQWRVLLISPGISLGPSVASLLGYGPLWASKSTYLLGNNPDVTFFSRTGRGLVETNSRIRQVKNKIK